MTVAAHLEELSVHAPAAEPAYRALMAHAVRLAVTEGLSEDARLRLEQQLRDQGGC